MGAASSLQLSASRHHFCLCPTSVVAACLMQPCMLTFLPWLLVFCISVASSFMHLCRLIVSHAAIFSAAASSCSLLAALSPVRSAIIIIINVPSSSLLCACLMQNSIVSCSRFQLRSLVAASGSSSSASLCLCFVFLLSAHKRLHLPAIFLLFDCVFAGFSLSRLLRLWLQLVCSIFSSSPNPSALSLFFVAAVWIICFRLSLLLLTASACHCHFLFLTSRSLCFDCFSRSLPAGFILVLKFVAFTCMAIFLPMHASLPSVWC